MLALSDDGRSLCIYNNDVAATVKEIEKFSAHDAKSYPEFVETFSRIGRVLAPLVSMTPPSIDQPAPADLWHLGKVGLAFRGLGKKDEYRLLRWGPMAVADLVSEWFETGVVARDRGGAWDSRCVCWSMVGGNESRVVVASGDGRKRDWIIRVCQGWVDRSTRRCSESVSVLKYVLRREVTRIDGAKVILRTGEEIEARRVVSNADPRTTFLKLVDPIDLDPNFLVEDAQLPRAGRRCEDQSGAVGIARVSRR